MLAWSPSTATPSPPTTANRPASTTHITRRRSQRSSRAPLSRPNSSHGSHSAKLTTDTSSGSRVSVAASNGSAVPYTPSPRLETPCAAHSLANPLAPATLIKSTIGQPRVPNPQPSTVPSCAPPWGSGKMGGDAWTDGRGRGGAQGRDARVRGGGDRGGQVAGRARPAGAGPGRGADRVAAGGGAGRDPQARPGGRPDHGERGRGRGGRRPRGRRGGRGDGGDRAGPFTDPRGHPAGQAGGHGQQGAAGGPRRGTVRRRRRGRGRPPLRGRGRRGHPDRRPAQGVAGRGPGPAGPGDRERHHQLRAVADGLDRCRLRRGAG